MPSCVALLSSFSSIKANVNTVSDPSVKTLASALLMTWMSLGLDQHSCGFKGKTQPKVGSVFGITLACVSFWKTDFSFLKFLPDGAFIVWLALPFVSGSSCHPLVRGLRVLGCAWSCQGCYRRVCVCLLWFVLSVLFLLSWPHFKNPSARTHARTHTGTHSSHTYRLLLTANVLPMKAL